ncbi:hypothetical protein N658DRAFT_360030 [Parathielavia hyrcaniae]|uniref:Uncharacterized protein n=1 Tax=Parathielavia hyrcaniae TaxID=113614 RepID=A0AAN6T2G2_9PEZI|nr:hypothetical protein N658DRAFT_360030 [Parathielavia hyrcaniae]
MSIHIPVSASVEADALRKNRGRCCFEFPCRPSSLELGHLPASCRPPAPAVPRTFALWFASGYLIFYVASYGAGNKIVRPVGPARHRAFSTFPASGTRDRHRTRPTTLMSPSFGLVLSALLTPDVSFPARLCYVAYNSSSVLCPWQPRMSIPTHRQARRKHCPSLLANSSSLDATSLDTQGSTVVCNSTSERAPPLPT